MSNLHWKRRLWSQCIVRYYSFSTIWHFYIRLHWNSTRRMRQKEQDELIRKGINETMWVYVFDRCSWRLVVIAHLFEMVRWVMGAEWGERRGTMLCQLKRQPFSHHEPNYLCTLNSCSSQPLSALENRQKHLLCLQPEQTAPITILVQPHSPSQDV